MSEGEAKNKKKKKFSKNSSFSGVGTKKSPENRRKSIAAVLPTPIKKNKKDKNLNEWIVSETDIKTVKRKQLIVTDNSEKLVELKVKSPSLRTPKKKKSKNTKEKKSTNESFPIKSLKVAVEDEKEKIKEDPVENEMPEDDVDGKDEKFGIQADDVAKVIKAVIKLGQDKRKSQKQLFEEHLPLYLQLTSHKVPKGPPRIIRIPVPNSLLTPNDEICLIVPDVKGIKNKEHEKHVEHYEDLLRRKGVENIKKIMTFHEFRTEYETYEQKSRLVDLYDMFLVDGRISGKVVNKCGKDFYKKRKVPTAVKLQATKLKEHINAMLSKAFFFLHLRGNCYSVQFGHDKMETQDLIENVFAVIEWLTKEFPGGFENFKGINVSSTKTPSIPLYSSFRNPSEVETPKIKPKKPKAYKTHKGELTTILNAEVVVKPTGEVLVKKKKIEKDEDGANKAVENVEDGNKIKVKKAKKRKLAEVVSNDGVNQKGNDAAVEENVGEKNTKTKKRKKQKHNEKLNEISQETANGTEESNEPVIKKKKKTKLDVDTEKNKENPVESSVGNKVIKQQKVHKKKDGKLKKVENKGKETANSIVTKKKKNKKAKDIP